MSSSVRTLPLLESSKGFDVWRKTSFIGGGVKRHSTSPANGLKSSRGLLSLQFTTGTSVLSKTSSVGWVNIFSLKGERALQEPAKTLSISNFMSPVGSVGFCSTKFVSIKLTSSDFFSRMATSSSFLSIDPSSLTLSLVFFLFMILLFITPKKDFLLFSSLESSELLSSTSCALFLFIFLKNDFFLPFFSSSESPEVLWSLTCSFLNSKFGSSML